MSSFPADRPRRGLAVLLALLVVIVATLGAAAWLFKPKFESDPPQVRITPDNGVLGLKPIQIEVSDPGSGLKSLSVTLTAGGTEHAIATEQFAQPAHAKRITIDPAKLPGLKEGPATLKVAARDASYANFFKGNEAAFSKEIAIDVTPPTIDLVADDRYVNFGGVGVIVYKPSADTEKSGIKVGDAFFPGFPGLVNGHADRYVALFAQPYNVPPETRAAIVATDKAGNTREMRLSYELKNVKYKKSTIALSESFMQNKVAPLLKDVAAKQKTPEEIFVAVNTGVRKENEDKITEITSKATPRILWKGAFAQLSNSKVEANFADLRTYTWQGKAVDTKYHVGYDLSVTKHYPIEAANSGKVVFTGDLGLYGNAVILDHGLGLHTLYGHMSAIDVKVGDTVEKKQVLGKTGETGLAAGDHLHYGVYLDGIAVLPVEWWDAKWIADNIEPKLAGGTSQDIAEAAPTPKSAKKKASRRH